MPCVCVLNLIISKPKPETQVENLDFQEFWDVFSPQMLEITQSELFDPWTS